MTKKTLVFFIIIILAFALSGCVNTSETTVASISISDSAFKDLYDIDEELNLEQIIITAKFKNGETLTIPCTADMVVGFDTKTSGDKSMYVVYKNVKSAPKEYKVVNKANQAVSITTTCRLFVQTQELPNAASYAFSIKVGDVSKISAISFTIKSDSDIGITADKMNMEITNLLSSWQAESYRVDKYTIKILVYKKSGLDITQDMSFATLNVIEQDTVKVTVNTIVVSDGEKDYYLPNIK